MVKRQVIGCDDYVEIVNPVFVRRVGYPLCREDMIKELLERPEVVAQAMRLLSPGAPVNFTRFVEAVASPLLFARGFGGRERRLHTYVLPELAGARMRVWSKRCARTGDYYPGGYDSGGYWGEPEYVPAMLANKKTHILLTVNLTAASPVISLSQHDGGFEIEICNVKKIED